MNNLIILHIYNASVNQYDYEDLNMMIEKNERTYKFFLDNPQYCKGSMVIKKLRSYNKTQRAVDYLLYLIGYED